MSDEATIAKPTPEVRYLRLREVCALTTMSVPQISRKVRAKAFPEPVKLGYRTRVWVESEVQAWLAAAAATRSTSSTRAASAS